MTTVDVVLEVRDLHTHFFLRRGVLKAVDGVSFSLHRSEVLGLVGESGCGKSMTALSIIRLLPRGAARTVQRPGAARRRRHLTKTPREMREIRGSRISMILQDPQTSLNPVFSIGEQLREALLPSHSRPHRRRDARSRRGAARRRYRRTGTTASDNIRIR